MTLKPLMPQTAVAVSCLLLLLISGCVTTQDFQQLQNQVYSLKRNQNANQQKAQKRFQALEQSIQKVEDRTSDIVSERTDNVRSTQANLWSEIESQRVQLATIKGRQEQLEFELQKLQQNNQNATQNLPRLQERLTRLEAQLQTVASQLGLELTETEAGVEIKDTEEAGPQDERSTPDILYEQALKAFRESSYDKAQSLWDEFANNFPDHALVPNAYFWQGECFYQLGNFPQAVLKYQKVIEKFSDSNKYPAALLKQGLSFYELDKNKAGRIILQELINTFPKSAEARRARIFLKDQ
jgi:tol-pal system protein YbgF